MKMREERVQRYTRVNFILNKKPNMIIHSARIAGLNGLSACLVYASRDLT